MYDRFEFQGHLNMSQVEISISDEQGEVGLAIYVSILLHEPDKA